MRARINAVILSVFCFAERGSCPRTAPPGARRKAAITAHGSAPGGAAPFAATRFVVAVQLDRTGLDCCAGTRVEEQPPMPMCVRSKRGLDPGGGDWVAH